jgi:hypothetical protein
MSTPPDLDIRLTDTQDIRTKLPAMRELLEVKRRTLIDAQHDLENWKLLVERLEAMARLGVGEEQPADVETASKTNTTRAHAQNGIVEALELAAEPLKPSALYQFMVERGMNAKNANAIGAATWQAWKAERIKKLPDGRYAALTYIPAELLSSNGPPTLALAAGKGP